MSRSMKDSGIAWVNKIPSDWDIHPLYYYFAERNRPNRRGKENNLLSLSYGKIIKKDINICEGLLPASYNSYNIIDPLDIVLRLTDLQNDKRSLRTGLSHERGIITSAYVTLKPSNRVCPAFFHYLLHAYDVEKVLYNMGNGVRQSLNYAELSKLPLLEPSLQEQQRIAGYLDKKCAEVEGLSSNIQKQIEALEQYKRAVITETVTKGLNPSVPMKDSGIPWVGQSPAHWGIKRIKFCCELSPKFHNKLSPNTLVSFLPMECVKQGFLVIEKEAELQDVKNGYTYFRENDIIMAKVTPCFENGNIAIAKGLLNNVGFGSSELYVFRPHKISVPFLFYFLQNTIFKNQAQSVMYGTGGLKRVPSEFIKNYQFACPPQSEQQAIAEYLDNKCSKIDTIIQDKQQQLEKLEQYKKAIIFEYVTGKKQVPEA